ncbi:MAG: glycosyltransferase [Conexivisphaera sp.]
MGAPQVALVTSRYKREHWLLRADLLASGYLTPISSEALRRHGPGLLRGYDAVIVFSDMLFHDDERGFLEAVLEFSGPVAVVDDRDDPITLRLASLPNVVYFKREYRRVPPGLTSATRYWISWVHLSRRLGARRLLLPSEEYALRKTGKILPLPLSISNSLPSDVEALHRSEKRYLVSMVANMNLPRNLWDYLASRMSSSERLRLARLLSRIPGSYVHTFNFDRPKLGHKLPAAAYAHVIASSTSSVAPRGSGCDTYRYYEIPALGSVLLSERSCAVVPNDFRDGEEALFFSSHRQLLRIIEGLASDAKLAASMARAGYEKYKRYHAPAARLRYLIENLMEYRARDVS